MLLASFNDVAQMNFAIRPVKKVVNAVVQKQQTDFCLQQVSGYKRDRYRLGPIGSNS